MNIDLSSSQELRINRVYNEKICLLELSKKTFDYHIKICGTTKNVYNLKLGYKGYNKGQILCDCPDGRKIYKNKLFCKHSCFVLIKILKESYPQVKDSIFKLLMFTDEQLKLIETELDGFNLLNNATLTDPHLLDKYSNYKDPDFKFKGYNKEETCLICFDEYGDSNVKSCPECKCVFHQQCITIWLNNSFEKTCPHCRSTVWKNLDKSTNYKNLA